MLGGEARSYGSLPPSHPHHPHNRRGLGRIVLLVPLAFVVLAVVLTARPSTARIEDLSR